MPGDPILRHEQLLAGLGCVCVTFTVGGLSMINALAGVLLKLMYVCQWPAMPAPLMAISTWSRSRAEPAAVCEPDDGRLCWFCPQSSKPGVSHGWQQSSHGLYD